MSTEITPLLQSTQLPEFSCRSSVTVLSKSRQLLFSSYIHVLLLFVPLGILSHFAAWPAAVVFVFNFFAIIPLASLLSYATEELAEHVGETVGGLINASFGNAVELIVAIVALARGEIRLVQASMLGSILSNLLLVLGCSFFMGGLGRIQQRFNATVAQTMAALMALATSSLLIPAAFNAAHPDKFQSVLALSRGTALVLLAVYVCYLVFQLRTHADYFEAQNQQLEIDAVAGPKILRQDSGTMTPEDRRSVYEDLEAGVDTSTLRTVADNGVLSDAHVLQDLAVEVTHLTKIESIMLLFIITVIVTFCADYLVVSINPIVDSTGMSKTFIGIILIPIVGNAAEHATAVLCAIKDKMDMAVGVAIGSSMQIALFMTPFMVILGWILGQPMSLLFTTFETCVLFISVTLLYYIVNDGESNWLEGVLLISTYLIISIAFFFTD